MRVIQRFSWLRLFLLSLPLWTNTSYVLALTLHNPLTSSITGASSRKISSDRTSQSTLSPAVNKSFLRDVNPEGSSDNAESKDFPSRENHRKNDAVPTTAETAAKTPQASANALADVAPVLLDASQGYISGPTHSMNISPGSPMASSHNSYTSSGGGGLNSITSIGGSRNAAAGELTNVPLAMGINTSDRWLAPGGSSSDNGSTKLWMNTVESSTGRSAGAAEYDGGSHCDGFYLKAEVMDVIEGSPFRLPRLPWPPKSLAPVISEETLEFHYAKHHATYVRKLNALAKEDTSLAALSLQGLDEVVKQSTGAAFNNAAQVWNHNFYWNSISPAGGGAAKGEIAGRIEESFGSFGAFRKAFSEAAAEHFGSGWVWLVEKDNGALEIVPGHDASNPLRDGSGKPLLTIDVWEHAYYIDYRNQRPSYIEGWFRIVNWDFANMQLTHHSVPAEEAKPQ